MNSCHPEPGYNSIKAVHAFTKRYSSILGILILVLPKCPFCLIAYSSAITLCGTSTLITHTTHHIVMGALVALGLGLIIITCLLITYRSNPQPALSVTVAFCGLVLIGIAIFKMDAMPYYFAGAGLMVIATLIYSGANLLLSQKMKKILQSHFC
jgi:hypothetical protein